MNRRRRWRAASGLLPEAHEPLLGDAHDEVAVGAVERAEGESACAVRRRAVLVVEEPLVRPERAVEPHAVVQAGAHELLGPGRHAVALEDRVDEGEVGGEGDDGRVDERVVGQRPVAAQPELLALVAGLAALPGRLGEEPQLEAEGAEELPGRFVAPRGAVGIDEAGDVVGSGDRRRRLLVVDPLLVDVERAVEVEDRRTVLDRHDAPGRERPAVADPVDLVEDRHRRVTGAEEVGVEGVDPPALDGPARRDERLGGELAAEDPLAARSLRYWPWPYGRQGSNSGLLDRASTSAVAVAASEREEREAVRLGYVGMTRARDLLIMAIDPGKHEWLNSYAPGFEAVCRELPVGAGTLRYGDAEIPAVRRDLPPATEAGASERDDGV